VEPYDLSPKGFGKNVGVRESFIRLIRKIGRPKDFIDEVRHVSLLPCSVFFGTLF
jgi:hypothetical protein